MPSKSPSQRRLMAAAAHDPAFAKKAGEADLRRELLATMADASREHIARYPKIRARLAE